MTTSPMKDGPPGAATAGGEPARTVDTSGCFDHSCVQTLSFDCPPERVYDALFRVAEWPEHLPHVQKMDILYDDGQYQEFWMTVRSETDGSPLKVRSIRNCRPGQIEFFQPVPPRFLRHHAGIWRFRAGDGEATCTVDVTHVWNLRPEVAAEVYPDSPERSTGQQVEDMLAGHSGTALRSWQRVLTGER